MKLYLLLILTIIYGCKQQEILKKNIDSESKFSLASHYSKKINLIDYYASEKLDGVRAYWDGKKLSSRQGNIFKAPKWFLKELPNIHLDGELWTKRNDFENIVSIVSRNKPDNRWESITYMIFDLPQEKESFRETVKKMKQFEMERKSRFYKIVKQFEIKSHKALQGKLEEIIALGGEGIMLRKKDSLYKKGRNKSLLKLKPYYDAEAKVIAINEGEGKYKGKMGSVTVETVEGIKFNVGSGFTDLERENPPSIGSIITYKFNGKTRKGKPRHPVYLRKRKKL